LSATNKPQEFAARIEEVPQVVAKKAMDLTAVLRSDATTARRALANHIQKLVLNPKRDLEPRCAYPSGLKMLEK
jgi:hypothetical protein